METFIVELLQRHRITVMTGRCSERFAGAEAYLPVFDVLRGLLDGHDRDDAIQGLKSHAPSWFSLIASSQTESDVRIQSPSEFTQERLKLEFRAFLTELSRVRPIALLLDDVHWADASTIDLLSYLAGDLENHRIVIVATCRSSELVQKNHPFQTLKLHFHMETSCFLLFSLSNDTFFCPRCQDFSSDN